MKTSIEAKWLILGPCLALLAAGCAGSNGIIDGAGGPSGSEALAAALEQVVLPAIDKLAAFSPVNQPAPPQRGTAGSDTGACARFDPFCFSGGFQVCPESSGEAVTFHYERCARPVGLVDGSWVLERNGLTATADLDLSIDGVALSGRISYVLDDMCWESSFVSFAATVPGNATTLDGTARYCLTTGTRHGRLDIVIAGDRGSFDLGLEFDGGTGSIVAVHEATTTLCSLDLRAGTATCRTD